MCKMHSMATVFIYNTLRLSTSMHPVFLPSAMILSTSKLKQCRIDDVVNIMLLCKGERVILMHSESTFKETEK